MNNRKNIFSFSVGESYGDVADLLLKKKSNKEPISAYICEAIRAYERDDKDDAELKAMIKKEVENILIGYSPPSAPAEPAPDEDEDEAALFSEMFAAMNIE